MKTTKLMTWLAASVMLVGLAACDNTPEPIVPPATLEAISITAEAKKTTFYVGDAFDTTGLEVTATYSDESVKVLTSSDYTLSLAEGHIFEESERGNKPITITYEDKTTTYTITIAARTYQMKVADYFVKNGMTVYDYDTREGDIDLDFMLGIMTPFTDYYELPMDFTLTDGENGELVATARVPKIRECPDYFYEGLYLGFYYNMSWMGQTYDEYVNYLDASGQYYAIDWAALNWDLQVFDYYLSGYATFMSKPDANGKVAIVDIFYEENVYVVTYSVEQLLTADETLEMIEEGIQVLGFTDTKLLANGKTLADFAAEDIADGDYFYFYPEFAEDEETLLGFTLIEFAYACLEDYFGDLTGAIIDSLDEDSFIADTSFAASRGNLAYSYETNEEGEELWLNFDLATGASIAFDDNDESYATETFVNLYYVSFFTQQPQKPIATALEGINAVLAEAGFESEIPLPEDFANARVWAYEEEGTYGISGFEKYDEGDTFAKAMSDAFKADVKVDTELNEEAKWKITYVEGRGYYDVTSIEVVNDKLIHVMFMSSNFEFDFEVEIIDNVSAWNVEAVEAFVINAGFYTEDEETGAKTATVVVPSLPGEIYFLSQGDGIISIHAEDAEKEMLAQYAALFADETVWELLYSNATETTPATELAWGSVVTDGDTFIASQIVVYARYVGDHFYVSVYAEYIASPFPIDVLAQMLTATGHTAYSETLLAAFAQNMNNYFLGWYVNSVSATDADEDGNIDSYSLTTLCQVNDYTMGNANALLGSYGLGLTLFGGDGKGSYYYGNGTALADSTFIAVLTDLSAYGFAQITFVCYPVAA